MEDEEEVLQRFGTPLEPLKEGEIPTKKTITIEEQIVTDENGKRRFHGAFTGGFSAGFWNTVGSLEGWKPAEFKSSRSEKAPQRAQQQPEDFMDDEDLGEFGIAPQRIQAQNDFQIDGENSRKRKLFQGSKTSGTIPGTPLLAELLRPVQDKIAVRILKSMGWKPGQGIGPRLTSEQKKRTRNRNKREEYVLRKYDCLEEEKDEEEMDKCKIVSLDEGKTGDYDEDDNDDGITFAPDDYDMLVCTSKMNRFGLGYSGLSHQTSDGEKPSHFNLFGPLEVVDKNNKKLSIRGQAFGVGALEEEDEDIYAGDDRTKYDFTLEDKQPKKKLQMSKQDRHIIDGFRTAQNKVQNQDPFLVDPPAGFQPRNWSMRRSRFAPLSQEKLREMEAESNYKKAGLGRHDLNPEQRGAELEDEPPKAKTRSLEELQVAQKLRDEKTKSLLERISAKTDNFTRGGLIDTKGEEIKIPEKEMIAVKEAVQKEHKILQSKALSKTAGLGAGSSDNTKFKPFLNNEGKQLRYEKFIAANLNDENEITAFLSSIQPVELSEFDREIERKEFMQARKIYKPLVGFMSQRFVSEAALAEEKKLSEDSLKEQEKSAESEKKIVMTRSTEKWKPYPLLCKRYNIAEPCGGYLEDTTDQKKKLSIYGYLEISVNKRDDFKTPVIIPKRLEKPKAIVDDRFVAKRTEKKQTEDSLTSAVKSSTELQLSQAVPTPSSNEVRFFKLPPKSELENRVEKSRDKPPSEKVELFRAIFEDSDDELEPQSLQQGPAPAAKLEIDKLALPTTSSSVAQIDLPKNNLLPGSIFATFLNSKVDEANKKITEDNQKIVNPLVPEKITFKPRRERQQDILEDTYGPSLPKKLTSKVKFERSESQKAIESRHMSSYEDDKHIWVEQTINNDNCQSRTSDYSDSSESSDSRTIIPNESSSKKHKKKSKKLKKHSSKESIRKISKKSKKHVKTKKKSKKKKIK